MYNPACPQRARARGSLPRNRARAAPLPSRPADSTHADGPLEAAYHKRQNEGHGINTRPSYFEATGAAAAWSTAFLGCDGRGGGDSHANQMLDFAACQRSRGQTYKASKASRKSKATAGAEVIKKQMQRNRKRV
eukprot:3266438-Pleurochrysis_carterae.AAC.1